MKSSKLTALKEEREFPLQSTLIVERWNGHRLKVRSYPRPRRGMVMPSGRDYPFKETGAKKNTKIPQLAEQGAQERFKKKQKNRIFSKIAKDSH